MTPSVTPKPITTTQSWRLRPRSAGRASSPSTTALVTSRSHTIEVGGTSSKRFFAIAAPSWTDRIPMTTNHTARCRPPGIGSGCQPAYGSPPHPVALSRRPSHDLMFSPKTLGV